jgi:L-seryl-tRNA(Ser) seleniumtransferase
MAGTTAIEQLLASLGVRPVVNAVGTWTMYGAAPACTEAAEATTWALGRSFVMAELQAAASTAIARATEAEAGCVTACSASGVALAIAACITGTDPARVRRLPDTSGLRADVVMLKGHVVDFGADVRQMARMAGARIVEAGTATHCGRDELDAAFTPQTAAVLYVVSHLCVQRGQPPLADVVAAAHVRGVPVVIDAAAEYDLRGFHRAGADLVVHSAHKFLAGPTAGLVAGRAALIEAVRAQDRGIGRPMKVGKEGIVGLIAALERWRTFDLDGQRDRDRAKLARAADRLGNLPGLSTELEPDTTDNPTDRLRVHVNPAAAGLDAAALGAALREGPTAFVVRDHLADLGYVLIDPRSLDDAELDRLTDRIAAIMVAARKA